MRKLEININNKFGRLSVVEPAGQDKKGEFLWGCSCVCGGSKITTSSRLKGGYVRSCGCLQREHYNSPRKNIRVGLAGKRCGKLVFVRDVGRNKWGYRVWLCKCDCGGETEVASNNFGKVNS